LSIEHAVDLLGEEVAHGALDDVGLLVEAGGGAVGLHLAWISSHLA
jgi:hypothetical protein